MTATISTSAVDKAAKAARKEADEIGKEIEQTEDRLRQAEDVRDDVQASIASGGGTQVPFEDWRQATARVEYETAVLDGLRKRLAKIERGTPNTDVRLAELVLPVIENHLGVKGQAIPKAAMPKEIDTSNGPVLLVVQDDATTVSRRTGSIGGMVEVMYVRTKLYAPLSMSIDFEDHLRSLGWAVGVDMPYTRGTDVLTDTARLRVRAAFPTAPALGELGDQHVSVVSESLRAAIRGAIMSNTKGGYRYDTSTSRFEHIKAEVRSAKITGSDVEDDGVRNTRIEATVYVRPDDHSRLGARDAVREALAKLHGTVLTGIAGREAAGLLRSSEIVSSTKPDYVPQNANPPSTVKVALTIATTEAV